MLLPRPGRARDTAVGCCGRSTVVPCARRGKHPPSPAPIRPFSWPRGAGLAAVLAAAQAGARQAIRGARACTTRRVCQARELPPAGPDRAPDARGIVSRRSPCTVSASGHPRVQVQLLKIPAKSRGKSAKGNARSTLPQPGGCGGRRRWCTGIGAMPEAVGAKAGRTAEDLAVCARGAARDCDCDACIHLGAHCASWRCILPRRAPRRVHLPRDQRESACTAAFCPRAGSCATQRIGVNGL